MPKLTILKQRPFKLVAKLEDEHETATVDIVGRNPQKMLQKIVQAQAMYDLLKDLAELHDGDDYIDANDLDDCLQATARLIATIDNA